MPEGNTIHRLAREQTRDFGGRIVRARSPQGRFAREARRLHGRTFLRADAHGSTSFNSGRLAIGPSSPTTLYVGLADGRGVSVVDRAPAAAAVGALEHSGAVRSGVERGRRFPLLDVRRGLTDVNVVLTVTDTTSFSLAAACTFAGGLTEPVWQPAGGFQAS